MGDRADEARRARAALLTAAVNLASGGRTIDMSARVVAAAEAYGELLLNDPDAFERSVQDGEGSILDSPVVPAAGAPSSRDSGAPGRNPGGAESATRFAAEAPSRIARRDELFGPETPRACCNCHDSPARYCSVRCAKEIEDSAW